MAKQNVKAPAATVPPKTEIISVERPAPKTSIIKILIGAILVVIGTFVLMGLGVGLHYLILHKGLASLDGALHKDLLAIGSATNVDDVSHKFVITPIPHSVVVQVNHLIALVNEHIIKKYFTAANGPTFVLSKISQPSPVHFTVSTLHIPIAAVFVIFLMTFLSKLPVSIAQVVAGNGRYNNAAPRAQQAKVTGWGHRALGAHQNSIEVFAPFAAAVTIFMLRFGLFMTVNTENVAFAVLLIKECIGFVALRIVYQILYLLNISYLRSIVWGAGVAVISNLFITTFMSA